MIVNYLLKTQQVETVQHLAVVLGRTRITVQRWLRQYRQEGILGMLREKRVREDLDGSLYTCAITLDGKTIIAGGSSGRIHFLRLEGV
ncbi:helix-turn-helix domain-containing protein [Allocoleopsis sp.]|uniref:helix-turn-helix domain-containing protein n=1 Tax=Allocoleopsis sp. TaxID=3088169 RepID=UPI002FD4D667